MQNCIPLKKKAMKEICDKAAKSLKFSDEYTESENCSQGKHYPHKGTQTDPDPILLENHRLNATLQELKQFICPGIFNNTDTIKTSDGTGIKFKNIDPDKYSACGIQTDPDPLMIENQQLKNKLGEVKGQLLQLHLAINVL